jgi:hypothetical protein
MLQDYAATSLSDVAEIVATIRALRHIAKESRLQTTKTQSLILRELPPAVLAAVAVELEKPVRQVATALGGGQ